MRFTSTMHNHCTLCDGRSTPEQMVEAAIGAGFTDLGMSCHAYAPFDVEYSIKGEDSYVEEITMVKEKYGDRIRIYCGIENDYYADCDLEKYQYSIASLHYLKDEKAGVYHIIDGSAEDLRKCCEEMFDGNGLAMAEKYFEIVTEHVMATSPEIIGHFDVITKCNGGNLVFDEHSAAYRNLVLSAADECLKKDSLWEVNTGAIARGFKNEPYPADFALEHIRQRGGRIIVTSDCHDAQKINFGFPEMGQYLKERGFRSVCQIIDEKIIENLL